jgi:biopolymer transport protein ExbB/TolQ
VAIPSLFIYRHLRGKVERIVVQMEKEGMKLVDAIEAAEKHRTASVELHAVPK